MHALAAIILFLLICPTSRVFAMAMPESDFSTYPRSVQSIAWDVPIVESGITTFSGLVRFSQGGLELAWTVDAAGRARLHTLDPSGSAELPPQPVKVHPVLLADGTALLAKEFYPLLNSRQPVSVKLVGIVDSEDLLAPLGLIEVPLGSASYHLAAGITYRQLYESHGVRIQEGVIALRNGSRSLLWQKTLDGSYKLAAVKEEVEIPLIPLLDSKKATAYLFEESAVDAQSIRVDYLLYMGKTALDVLLEGFNRL